MKYRIWIHVGLTLLVASACDSANPVAPERPEPVVAPSLLHPPLSVTAEGFGFLPPLGPWGTAREGSFNPDLLDLLRIQICEWGPNGCERVLRVIDDDSRPLGRLRVYPHAEFYMGIWPTWQDRLDRDARYRIRVMSGDVELGGLMVEVARRRRRTGYSTRTGTLVVRRGQIVPIPFRVTSTLGDRATPEGGTIALSGGAIELTLSPGAVDRDLLITATPATAVDDASGVVPGTAWDLGPDGLSFDAPVQMSIHFDASALPPGVDPATLRIHEVVEGDYVELPDGSVDLQRGVVSATVDGFSVFAVLPAATTGYQIVSLHPGVEVPLGSTLLVGDDQQVVFADVTGQYWSYSSGTVRALAGASPTVFEVGPNGTAVGWEITGTGFSPTIWVNGVKSTLPGGPGRAFDINSNGQILGDRDDGTGVVWTNGAVSEVIAAPGQFLRVRYLNDAGAILGQEILPTSRQAFIWDSGSRTPIPSVAPIMNIGAAVSSEYLSDTGFAVGAWANAPASGAWYWDGSSTQAIPDLGFGMSLVSINSSGVAAGLASVGAPSVFSAVTYDGTNLTQLGTLGGSSSRATGINDVGTVIGTAMDTGGLNRAFAYHGASLIDLGTLGGNQSHASDINESGVIVGTAEDSGGVSRAVAWIPVSGGGG